MAFHWVLGTAMSTTGLQMLCCNYLVIVLIVLLIIVDTSECERGFSLVNRLKTDERNRLKISNLNNLAVTCNLAVPKGSTGAQAIAAFVPMAVFDLWVEGSSKGRCLDAKFNDLFNSTPN